MRACSRWLSAGLKLVDMASMNFADSRAIATRLNSSSLERNRGTASALLICASAAIASIDAHGPLAANTVTAASSICCSRTARGNRFVPPANVVLPSNVFVLDSTAHLPVSKFWARSARDWARSARIWARSANLDYSEASSSRAESS